MPMPPSGILKPKMFIFLYRGNIYLGFGLRTKDFPDLTAEIELRNYQYNLKLPMLLSSGF
jgi:hypothetical protein